MLTKAEHPQLVRLVAECELDADGATAQGTATVILPLVCVALKAKSRRLSTGSSPASSTASTQQRSPLSDGHVHFKKVLLDDDVTSDEDEIDDCA